jgi:tRNA (cytidine/uridine-2'-O-)-methyltransferase
VRIILVHPQIPQNTGNVVRTCAVTGSDLTLIEPLGFSTSNKMLERAGLDYWEGVSVSVESDLMALLEKTEAPFVFFSSKGKPSYTDFSYPPDSYLIFGSETKGLPEACWQRWPDRFATIPMIPGARCLNLASSVAVVTYEAWRQQDFTSQSKQV